jgi:sucrose phosphorylase
VTGAAVDGAASATTGPHLIAYADRFGGTIAGLTELLRGPFAGAFTGVHVLPFYSPFDGSDAGFDPRDHTEVDPRLGAWSDLRELARSHEVMADLIVNHVSADAAQFRDFVANGDGSPWREMFLTMSSVFPAGVTEADLAAIYRPRPGLPFTAMTVGGARRLVWTTFTAQQVDLDIRSTKTWDYLTGVIDRLTGAGVGLIRLDAAGYVAKAAGTSCFMTPAALDFIRRLRRYAHQRGARVLVEIHAPYHQQVEAAGVADYVYDFALPPLVLYALLGQNCGPLASWLAMRPANIVTVLDTHDGIGVIDAGPMGEQPGLLDAGQLDTLVEGIHANSGGASRIATGTAASNLDLYQVNCTFYDALGSDDDAYLLARLIQLFLPGTPQIYYVGLLAGKNDVDLLRRTGTGRDINRHHYSLDEIRSDLERRVVRDQLSALRFRAAHPAFGGEFGFHADRTHLELRWRHGVHNASLVVDVEAVDFLILATGLHGTTSRVRRDNLGDLDTLTARAEPR